MKKKREIVQSNTVTEAQYSMTFDQLFLFKLVVSEIKKNDKDFQEYVIKKTDIIGELGIRKDGAYSYLRTTTTALLRNVVEIYDEDEKTLTKYPLFSKITDRERSSDLVFEVHKDLKNKYIELKRLFTQYDFSQIKKLKDHNHSKAYGIRLYELGVLIIGRNKGRLEYSIEDIGEMFNLSKSYINRPSSLIQRVIKPYVKKVNAVTNINLSYELIRKGKGGKIVAIEFISSWKTEVENENFSKDDIEKIKTHIDRLKISQTSENTIKKWLEKYEAEDIKKALVVAEEYVMKSKKGVSGAFITKALQDKWESKHSEQQKEQQKFRDEADRKVELRAIKEETLKLNNLYNDEVWKTAQTWFKDLSESEQETFKNQYMSQNSFLEDKEKKAPSPTSSYNAHITMLYKNTVAVDNFGTWLKKHAKKKKIEISKEMWFAVAETR